MYTFHRNILLFLFLTIYLKNAVAVSRVDPLVETNLGLIRGLKSSDGKYSMFLGIPYASVDETNPFGPSTPHQGFDETFDAFDDSAICPQVEEFNNTIVGSLDCLHLNIYVPSTASSQNRLPVLVFIYGGGLQRGFSGRYLYGPSYIVRHDIILITLNHRVGPYGFMCLDNPKVPGNQGLKDQRTALKWIKDNIEAFGGNADKVTIVGRSSGATSVGLHLQYQDEVLFDKVIMQSGTFISPTPPVAEPDRAVPLKLAEYLGFGTNTEDDALNLLSTVDPKLIIAASTELNLFLTFCVENDFGDDVQRFITEHPLNKPHPNLKNTPIIIGYNNNEGLYDILNYKDSILLNEKVFRNHIVDNFYLETEEVDAMELLLKHFYVADESISENTVPAVIDFRSDVRFNYGAVRAVKTYIENGAENIYHYVFSYDGVRNFFKYRYNVSASGAAHTDEIGYLFDVSFMTDKPTPEDQTIIDRITTLWTNFVKHGNPTPETTELLPVSWTPVSKDSLLYLDIDTEMTVKKRPFHDRMAFMELFYKVIEKSEKGFQSSRN